MTDPDLIWKRIAFVESCIADLQSLAQPERLRTDVREERFVLHTLQIAIQAVLDIASHIASSERLGEPDTYRSLFDTLERAGWLDVALADRLRQMAGFRNIVVHGYADVDPAVIERILSSRLDDLLAFCAIVRERMPAA